MKPHFFDIYLWRYGNSEAAQQLLDAKGYRVAEDCMKEYSQFIKNSSEKALEKQIVELKEDLARLQKGHNLPQ